MVLVAFSPDGETLAAGSVDGAVTLWDVATKRNIATFGVTGELHSVAFSPAVSFSPDGETLAAGSVDGSVVTLWDVATKRNIATFRTTGEFHSVSFSPDGETLAAGAFTTIQLWDVATKTNVATFAARGTVYSVAFSPDGSILASGEGAAMIQLWDVATKTNVATFAARGAVYSVAFSPDGSILASGATDDEVQLWDVSEWTESRPYSLGGNLRRWPRRPGQHPTGRAVGGLGVGSIRLTPCRGRRHLFGYRWWGDAVGRPPIPTLVLLRPLPRRLRLLPTPTDKPQPD